MSRAPSEAVSPRPQGGDQDPGGPGVRHPHREAVQTSSENALRLTAGPVFTIDTYFICDCVWGDPTINFT